jgi:hypothetical protein
VEMLEVNKTLSAIDLASNRIMDVGFVMLVRALEGAENVVSLNVSSNEITVAGLIEVQ